ncbi:hypothetical protein PUNSTDRAFT_111591 [Punctularia strigosozonata HHB-11173 SS5]|uniref:uncharacterized protein n=1 Tax=Punctularia strigosozonata (strain HHB-11173) TaxID=741275 RepID=UPI0004416BC1|nr:uncharacterized protein PUNSTDRAFT_111591 [Punctularia strigosozonata HHB-11173 SS5]EIN11444.1 hypothetical protein PUNSTDRAFT_111591 [Punctularia strigosozonata HHB-11173 SS5]
MTSSPSAVVSTRLLPLACDDCYWNPRRLAWPGGPTTDGAESAHDIMSRHIAPIDLISLGKPVLLCSSEDAKRRASATICLLSGLHAE